MGIKQLVGSRAMLVVLAVVSLVGTLFFWMLFPWPDQVYTHEQNGRSYRVEETRRYRILPRKEWGISSSRKCFCGPTSGDYHEMRFGFLEMIDMTATTALPRLNRQE
jgi:hypothetical protein